MARSFVQLSMDERGVIARMHEKKISQAETARTQRRDRSTICRELRRNFWHDREVPIAEGYWHVTAQQMAEDRRRRYRKLLRDPQLCAAVIDRLKDGWSPEQISGRLRLISESSAQLSHETIYQYVYSPEGQDQQLGRHLPERRRKRRPRYARKPRRLDFPIECAIRHRPDSINSRSDFGHWEADLMIFRKEHGSANMATVVERKSRYTVLFRNNDRRSKPITGQTDQPSRPPTRPRPAKSDVLSRFGIRLVARAGKGHGNIGLVLRPASALAERHGREHQQACSALPAGRDRRPGCDQSGDPSIVRPSQHHPAQVPRVPDAEGDLQPVPVGYEGSKHVGFSRSLHSIWNHHRKVKVS